MDKKESPVLGHIRNTEITPETKQARLEALTNFNKIANNKSKIVELPYRFTYGWSKSSIFNKDYTVEDIEEARNNKNVLAMRRISNFYYDTSSSYRRILDFFANLYKYYYTLDLANLTEMSKKATGKKRIRQLYDDSLEYLDGFEIEATFAQIAQRMLVDGAFYGYVTDFGDEGQVITMLDPDFCRSRYKSPYGTNIVEFDVSFFVGYSEEERNQAFKTLPNSVRAAWNRVYGSGDNLLNVSVSDARYAILPANQACAFKFDGIDTPPLFDTIIDIINFNEYKAIEKQRDMQELEKLLIQRFDLDDNGNLELLLPEIQSIHQAVSGMLADNIGIDVLTSLANEIKLESVQDTSGSVSNNNIAKMLIPKYENAGLSPELFTSTTATSLELSISNATSFMSPAIHDFSIWLTMMVYGKFSFGDIRPVVTILPLTWYNDKRMNDMYLKNAQMGYDKVLPYVASGKRQSVLADIAILQNDILNLDEILIPLQTSFTQSGSTGSSGARQKGDVQQSDDGMPRQKGRPPKSPEDRSEKTNKNREAMSLGGIEDGEE